MTARTIERVGPWGSTATGLKYWPEDPRVGDFSILDIAHALANQCRFGGHCREFYSVAQHCVLVSEHVPEMDALWGLLHDASEAYLVDIPRPVKYADGMQRYVEIEARFMAKITAQFGLSVVMPDSVRLMDDAILAAEARDLMPAEAVRDWHLAVLPPLDLTRITPWSPAQAKAAFLYRFQRLTGLEVAA